MDEAMESDGSVELLAALVKVFKPALLDAYRSYVRQTNGLADYESVRLMRAIIAEEEETLDLLEAAYSDVVQTVEEKEVAAKWAARLRRCSRTRGESPARPKRGSEAFKLCAVGVASELQGVLGGTTLFPVFGTLSTSMRTVCRSGWRR